MHNKELELEIKILNRMKDDIQKRIEFLQSSINKNYNDSINLKNKTDYDQGFFQYLTVVKGLNIHTANNYFGCLRGLKTRLEKYEGVILQEQIYNIKDKSTLLYIKNKILSCEKIKKDNKKGHNSFSAAFNNYLSYVYSNNNATDMVIDEFVLDE